MKNIKELKAEDLKSNIPLNFDFKTTKDLEPFIGIIGQEKAMESIKSAMEIKYKGFNLYVSGDLGIGKTNYILSVINNLAKTEDIPNDICYIHNFDNPSKPIYLSLEPGLGFEFKTDMNKFISSLLTEINLKLSGDNYQKEKKDILLRFELNKKKILSDFDTHTFKLGFKIKYNKSNISYSPVFNGKIIDETEFSNLSDTDKKYYKEKSDSIQAETMQVLNKLNKIDKEAKETIKIWEENLATFIVTQLFKDLKIKYKKNLKLQNFFYNIQSDIITNLEIFKQFQEHLKSNNSNIDFDSVLKKTNRPRLPIDNYKVNLLVDNDSVHHAPVILCKNPTYHDLFGNLEFENSKTGSRTDHTMLKQGLLHKANGGYIILNVKDIVSSMPTWQALKRALMNNEITMDSSRDLPTPPTMPKLKPEAIPLNIQCVLIGSEANYMNLCKLDPDFKKIFKIKAQFQTVVDKSEENTLKLARYISYLCKKYELLSFTKDAVIKIVDISSKIASSKNKLTANMQDIKDIVLETNYIAKKSNKKKITADEVIASYNNRKSRYSAYDDHINEMISNGSVIISTEGKTVGQINGLTIVKTGGFLFGKPVRITANTFIGKKGIVNIEKEVALSGSSHSKGVLILSAYIGEKYAQDFPLNLNASICFEQLYNGVDGDSASSTELYAILSSLASVPIKQNFAVTGSVNQKGEIQPIGGVSEKIEGFYNVCKKRGFKDNSVLIPKQNVDNLNLNNEIIESIGKGEFHIYPISTIDQGIELLTGIKAGKLIGSSRYEKGSINDKVYAKLRRYAEKSK